MARNTLAVKEGLAERLGFIKTILKLERKEMSTLQSIILPRSVRNIELYCKLLIARKGHTETVITWTKHMYQKIRLENSLSQRIELIRSDSSLNNKVQGAFKTTPCTIVID
jgi:hypothetical protein